MSKEEYGFLPGRYPAIVRSYDAGVRMCRVEIPGLTDGGDMLPLAEIEYSLGDKSRAGTNATEIEIEITPGDTIWVAFIGGDARYPIITGYRNPQANNAIDWRRFHHRNLELLADQWMNFIAGGDLFVKSGAHVTVQAPHVTIDSPQTDVTGKLTVQGLLSYAGGMSGSGGSGSASTITGNVTVDGNIHATGTVMDGGGNSNHHSH